MDFKKVSRLRGLNQAARISLYLIIDIKQTKLESMVSYFIQAAHIGERKP